jgi:HEAT repeat protein
VLSSSWVRSPNYPPPTTAVPLGGPHIVEALLKLLNPHPKSLYTFDFQLRLLEAFGSLGERRPIEPLAQLLNHQVHSPYEWYFQEYLAKALRQLGDTRAELQAVELALQHRAQTRKLTVKATFRPLQQNNDH